MLKAISFSVLSLALVSPAGAALLFLDTFNTADSGSFDAASTAGRLSGPVAGTEAVLRSWGAQQAINANQLVLPAGGNSGVRFEQAAGTFGATNRYNWAAGATGSGILAAGGYVVAFDWIPVADTSTNWISFQVGTINGDSGNLTDDDYGILFRQNGNTERFDNSVNLGAGGAFTATAGGIARHIEITYTFSSFADGSTVNAVSTVNGVQVASDNFTWDSNGGALYFELGNNDPGNRIDNLSVATVPEPGSAVVLGLAGLGVALRRRRCQGQLCG